MTAVPQLPGYVLEDLLGTGASASVWRGVQVETGQAVAVKILDEKVVDIAYLSAEVERLARITGHPNVVTLLDARLTHHPPFLVTPLLSGSIEGKRPTAEQAWVWVEQMVDALD